MAKDDILSKYCRCSGSFKLHTNKQTNPLAFYFEELIDNLSKLASDY